MARCRGKSREADVIIGLLLFFSQKTEFLALSITVHTSHNEIDSEVGD